MVFEHRKLPLLRSNAFQIENYNALNSLVKWIMYTYSIVYLLEIALDFEEHLILSERSKNLTLRFSLNFKSFAK